MNNKVELTIIGEAGRYTYEFNVHEGTGQIIRSTMKYFGISESLFPQFELVLEDTTLNNSATIQELHLNAESRLYLRNKGPLTDGGYCNA